MYFPSLSGRTFVYKGMLTTTQLKAFYLDLQEDRLTSALGIVRSRFSTNTFPSWPLAHPFRRIAHNGEINTVTGNENWMRAREALIKTDVFGSEAGACTQDPDRWTETPDEEAKALCRACPRRWACAREAVESGGR